MGALLLSEWLRFPATVLRAAHDNAGFLKHLASAFDVDFWRALAAGSYEELRSATLADNHRTIGFGSVGALVAVATLFVRVGPRGREIKAGFVASLLFVALSDVVITRRQMRRVATFHGIIAFVFNLCVLALTVNVLSGAL